MKTANYKLDRRMYFRDLHVSIETDKGKLRHWHDPHNNTDGTTKMKYPYGYIRRTSAPDGDHVDCYVGPNERAKYVYVIHQMKAPEFKTYDEDKCMLGFLSENAARTAYLAHYNDKRFLGSMSTIPYEAFRDKVLHTFDLKRPGKITESEKPMQNNFKAAYYLGAQHAQSLFTKHAAAEKKEDLLNTMLNAAETYGTAGYQKAKELGQKGYSKARAAAEKAIASMKMKKKASISKEAFGIKTLLAGLGLLGGGAATAHYLPNNAPLRTVANITTKGVSGERTQRGLSQAGIGGF